jgi:hypothetical protein
MLIASLIVPVIRSVPVNDYVIINPGQDVTSKIPVSNDETQLLSVSRNWSGYTAVNGTFTSVGATWTVPQIPADSGSGSADAAWIGIGGATTNDLIQTGIQSGVDDNGQVFYRAFYETLPEASIMLDMPVNGGDSVTASVSEAGTGKWNIHIKDNTNGQSKTIPLNYDSTRSSAEWIEEEPSGIRRIFPLDKFGSVGFTDATVVKNGTVMTPKEAGVTAITMRNQSGDVLASTTPISPDGKSFSVNRTDTVSDSQSRSTYTGSYRHHKERWIRIYIGD